MGRVIRTDFLALIDAVQDHYESDTGLTMNDFSRREEYFDALATRIAEKTGVSIKASTLYKSYYLEAIKSKEEYFSIYNKYVNALSRYCFNQNYSVRYSMDEKRSTDFNLIEQDPEMPEFPVSNPSFPATPTIPIFLKSYDKWIFVKDESKNYPITNHKARAAWEIFLSAKKFLADKYKKNEIGAKYRASILTSGNFALAIFSRLLLQGINFQLNVIVDKLVLESDDPRLKHKKDHLLRVKEVASRFPFNLKVYPKDIHSKRLTSKDILEMTENEGGIDLTFGEEIKSLKNSYFDWLCYEILSQSPDYIFSPFGSGDFMTNILEILIKELRKNKANKSKRYFGFDDVLSNCNFYGITTVNNYSVFDKLYAPKEFHPAYDFVSNLSKYYNNGIKGEIDIVFDDEFTETELMKYIKEAKGIYKANNIKAEPSGLSSMVLFLKKLNDERELYDNKKVLILNTGIGEWDYLLSEKFRKLID